jgi:hypothetical protein
VWLRPLDCLISHDVRGEKVVNGSKGGREVATPPWRENAVVIGIDSEDIDLVRRNPVVAEVAETLYGNLVPTSQFAPTAVIEPRVGSEPRGIRKVMQRDERYESPIEHGLQNFSIVGHSRFVNKALSGLNAAPFEGHAKSFKSHGNDEIELTPIVDPEIIRETRRRDPVRVFPIRPVVSWLAGPVVATFNLKSGGRNTKFERNGPSRSAHAMRIQKMGVEHYARQR